MVKKIFFSETDRNNLSRCKTIIDNEIDKFNYRKKVVIKPWGYEYLMFENDYVAIWILNIKKNQTTSIHCHPRKKTSLLVLSGKVSSATLNDWFNLKPLDGLIYESGVFHTTKALTEKTVIMEIETPPDKKDLVRLKDAYGRENSGYEGKNKMSKNFKKFKCCFFESKTISSEKTKKIGNVLISFKKCRSNFLEEEIDRSSKKSIYCILEEKIVEDVYKPIFEVGSIFNLDDFGNKKKVRLFNNALLLLIKPA